MAVYRMYVDETGSGVFRPAAEVENKYLALTGVIVDREYHTKVLQPTLEALKKRHFLYDPDDPPILHRADIKGRRGCFGCLKDPEKDKVFRDDLVSFLETRAYHLITVVIDKDAHRKRHGDEAWEPYRYCFRAILQRYTMFMGRRNQGDVMVEARGKREDRQLAAQYASYYDYGDYYISREEVQKKFTSRELKLKTKDANIAGLQIADLLVTEIKREILTAKAAHNPGSEFCRRILTAIRHKHHSSWRGQVEGVGKIWIGPPPAQNATAGS